MKDPFIPNSQYSIGIFPICHGHLSTNYTWKTPIALPLVWYIGVIREFKVWLKFYITMTSQCVSNHQPHDCLLNRLFRPRSKETSVLRVTGLCAGNSPLTDEFPTQMASNAENVSIWWRHHDLRTCCVGCNNVLWYTVIYGGSIGPWLLVMQGTRTSASMLLV